MELIEQLGGKVEVLELKQRAKNIRKSIVTMLEQAGSGHPGGSLSSADLLTVLYSNHMKFDPKKPTADDRDYFVLSKGHGCPALYAVLAEIGCFDKTELDTLRKQGSRLQGHPGSDKKLPGIEVSTGSLGYGLSIGAGIASGMKIKKQANRVYVLMGDGEQQEGSIWEAAMYCGHYGLDNLCAIIDINRLQIDGGVESVMGVEPLKQKYVSFGWSTIEIDGHDIKQIDEAFKKAKGNKGTPTIILAKTIKGKGVSFMENLCEWHGKTPNKEETEKAIKEIDSKD